MGGEGRHGHCWLLYPRLKWPVCLLFLLAVSGEVYIIKAPENQRVRAGTEVTFRCVAGTDSRLRGQPNIEWHKDSQKIIYRKDRRFRQEEISNTLFLKNASTSDTGIYSCVARQSDDRAKAEAQLVVEDVPDAPIDVELVQCRDRIAHLQWKLIGENYSPVTQFIIEYNTSFDPSHWHVAKTQLPRDRHYQRIALSPWGNYSFRVIAQNAVGYSPPSAVTAAVCHMPPEVPHHNPRGVCTINGQPGTLTIYWQPVPKTGQNGPGFYYLVKWRQHSEKGSGVFRERVVDVSINSLTVKDQPIFQDYEIYVLAVNQISEAVAPPQMKIGYSAEDVPEVMVENFRLDPDKDVTAKTANFIWDKVNRGPWLMKGLFRGYKIQYWKTHVGITSMRNHTIVHNDPDEYFCPARPATRWKRHEVDKTQLYNLWPYTNISAQIVVLNAKYQGPPSHRITFMTAEGVPGPVAEFDIVRRGSNYLDLHWQRPLVVNGVLLGYTLSYKVIDSHQYHHPVQVELSDADIGTMRLENLLSEQTYRVTIWARTRRGAGQTYDIEGTTLPSGPPVAPNFTTVNTSKRAVNVSWFPSVRTGNPGRVFEVLYRRTGDLQWERRPVPVGQRWLEVEGLQSGVHYEMRVVARNSEDPNSPETSSPVQTVVIGLKRDLPRPTFKVSYVNQTSFGVSLVKFDTDVRTFYVQYKRASSDYSNWRTTDDYSKYEWAYVHGLQAGRAYQLKVTTKSYFGQSQSYTQQFTAGNDPDAQPHLELTGASSLHCVSPPVISAVLLSVTVTAIATSS